MNFHKAFSKEKRQIPHHNWDNVIITPELVTLIEKHDVNWYRGVINGILCVESNGLINHSNISKNQREQHQLKYKPLKGLYKVHVRLPGIQQLVNLLALESKIDNNGFNETDPKILLKDIFKVKDMRKTLCSKRQENKITGCWLIYGIHEDVRYYLWVDTGEIHSYKEDQRIYNTLVQTYPSEFLSRFLKN